MKKLLMITTFLVAAMTTAQAQIFFEMGPRGIRGEIFGTRFSIIIDDPRQFNHNRRIELPPPVDVVPPVRRPPVSPSPRRSERQQEPRIEPVPTPTPPAPTAPPVEEELDGKVFPLTPPPPPTPSRPYRQQ